METAKVHYEIEWKGLSVDFYRPYTRGGEYKDHAVEFASKEAAEKEMKNNLYLSIRAPRIVKVTREVV